MSYKKNSLMHDNKKRERIFDKSLTIDPFMFLIGMMWTKIKVAILSLGFISLMNKTTDANF